MSDENLKQNLFKWIMEVMIGLLIVAFGFQQNQISKIEGKLDGFQSATNSGIASIKNDIGSTKEDVAAIKEGMSWVKDRLEKAEITK